MNTRQHSDNANDKWATLTRADIPPAMIVLIMTPMLLVPIMPKPRPEPSLIRSMTSTCTSGELNCTHQTQQLADIFIYDSENIRLEETTSTKKTKTKNKNDILQKWYDTTSSHKQRAVCPNTFNFRCKHHLLQHSINCRLTHKINVKKTCSLYTCYNLTDTSKTAENPNLLHQQHHPGLSLQCWVTGRKKT